MSRHYLTLRGKPAGHVIVGYDRPVVAFFCQVWSSADDDYPSYEDSCFDLNDLPDLGAVVPEELVGILVREAAGDIDPNYTKDWRSP